MLRVILVDDERIARQGLRSLLAAHPSIEVVGEAGRVAAATALIAEHKPDAVFLDIQMPRANGFQLIEQLDNPPKVVFVTAHSEHAVKAFAVQAVDYLLKPVRPERLAAAVQRLSEVCANREESARYRQDDRICLRTPQRTVVASLSDIVAIEADGDFSRYHIAGQAPLLLCRTLASSAQTLPSPPFLRVSRSLVLNLARLRGIEHPTRDTARLSLEGSDRVFSLGRRALARLKAEK